MRSGGSRRANPDRFGSTAPCQVCGRQCGTGSGGTNGDCAGYCRLAPPRSHPLRMLCKQAKPYRLQAGRGKSDVGYSHLASQGWLRTCKACDSYRTTNPLVPGIPTSLQLIPIREAVWVSRSKDRAGATVLSAARHSAHTNRPRLRRTTSTDVFLASEHDNVSARFSRQA